MSRSWIGAVALALTVGGVLAPSPARAETTAASATATPSAGDEVTSYTLSVAGFDPGVDSVGLEISVDGQPYGLNYDRRRNIAADGTGSWSWPWSAGDPAGTYVFTFTDRAGHTADTSITINHSESAPVPAAGTHLMLDTLSAPPLSTVEAWQGAGAAYQAIGVYLPVDAAVDNRADKDQANLVPTWVSAVESGGWRVVPIHVGLQAPDACQMNRTAFHEMSADPAVAMAQGRDAADSAAAEAAGLRIDSSRPVIADIEPYNSRPGCSTAVQAYLEGWTNELHRLGRHPGVYGTPGSVGKDLAAAHAADTAYVLPDVLWAATDNHRVSTSVTNLPGGTWKIANQYLLGIERSYDGTAMTIDETAVDDAVWTLPAVVPATDATDPIVTMSSAPWLVSTARATFAWTGVDAASGLAGYEVRTARATGGRTPGGWGHPTTVPGAAQSRTTVTLKPGEAVCVEVRAVDRAGNRSAWSRPSCSARLADDRAAKAGAGWKRARHGGAYAHTLSTASKKGAVLTLGTATAGSRLGVVRSGRGTLVVKVNGRRTGALGGDGIRALALPRAGKVTLTTSSAKKVTVDAYVLAAKPRA